MYLNQGFLRENRKYTEKNKKGRWDNVKLYFHNQGG